MKKIRNLLGYRFESPLLKWTVIVAVLCLELTLTCYIWKQSGPKAQMGFLIKRGNHYALIWKTTLGYRSLDMKSVDDALDFAQNHLSLEIGRNATAELEHLWMQDRFGTYLILWKLDAMKNLNQMTFYSQKDAVFFAKAFRQGSYSRSPFGHSVLFVPSATN